MLLVAFILPMQKVKRSISIDEDLNNFFKEDPTINASSLINLLIRRFVEEEKENE